MEKHLINTHQLICVTSTHKKNILSAHFQIPAHPSPYTDKEFKGFLFALCTCHLVTIDCMLVTLYTYR